MKQKHLLAPVTAIAAAAVILLAVSHKGDGRGPGGGGPYCNHELYAPHPARVL